MTENEKTAVNNSPAPTGGNQPLATKTVINVTQPQANINGKMIVPLEIIDGNTLMAQNFEPLGFAVEKILPHGIYIFAGTPKAGKSWLTLDLCRAVATGGKLWNFATTRGDVLYLALEDKYPRLHDRLKQMEAERLDISRLHLATASLGLRNGLLEQVHSFVAGNPGTNLIAIDTLEHIRDGEQDKNIYSCDYKDMTLLRQITDRHNLTLLLVHHTRKMYDPDPINTISGSTGLIGAVDGAFVLEKNKRTGDKAKLTIANRDTEDFCFDLRFDTATCRWSFIGNHLDSGDDEDVFGVLLNDFLKDDWSGTATELCHELKKLDGNFDLIPATMKKRLKSQTGLFEKEYGVAVEFERTHGSKRIFLRRLNL